MSIRFALAVPALALLLAGCPAPPTAPPPPSAAPRVTSFTASAQEVEPGASVTLTWETKDAVSVELRDADRGLVSGVESGTLSGSVEIAVTKNSLFVLTAANDRGVRDSAPVSVRVTGGAQDVSFVAAPDRLAAGQSATLAWSAPGAKVVSLATAEGDPVDIGEQKRTGSVQVNPTRTTTWHLDVDGAIYEATVTVAAEVNVFVAAPESVEAGQPLTLAWQTRGAVKVTVSGAGRGELHTTTEPSQVADGSFTETMPAQLNPAAVFSYVLRAEAPGGEVTERTLSLYVAGSPRVIDFQVPRYAPGGLTFTATWETAEADIVEILRGNLVVFQSAGEAEAAAGSVEMPTPSSESSFTLRARNSRGGSQVSDAKLVEPVGVPTIASFVASPQPGIAQGGEPVTLTWSAPNARTAVVQIDGGPVIATYTGPAAEGGTHTVYPNSDTTYTLTVDNGIGNVDGPEQATVTVLAPAGFVFDPPTAPAGATVVLQDVTFTGGLGASAQPMFNLASSKFEDISTTGVDIAYPSNFSTTAYKHDLTQPFRTTLFGETVDVPSVSITINGWFCFCSTATQGGTVPTPTTMLPSTALPPWSFAPFWYNLRSTTSTKIYHQVDGVAPNRRLVLQWTNVRLDAVVASNLTFQVRIHEDGTVIFAYRELEGATGHTPSVGVVNIDETQFEVLGRIPESIESYTWNHGQLTFPMNVIASGRPYEVTVDMGGGQKIDVSDTYPLIPSNQFEISELNVQPLVTGGQWFEVTNKTATAIDLAGWALDFGGGSTHTVGALMLPPNGRAVLAQNPAAGDGVTVNYVYGAAFAIPQGGGVAVTVAGFPYAELALPPASLPPGRTWQKGAPAPGLTMAAGVFSVDCLASTASTYGTAGQLGTPGGPNTACPNYDAPISIPGSFDPIALTGTELVFPNKDDDALMVQLPSPVVLDGASFSQLWVGVNGFISFNPTFTCPQYCYSGNKATLDPVLAPVGVMAPFWDDIDSTVAGGIFWERKVDHTIVSWEGVHRFDDATDVLNFQVKFFDTGTIEFHYGTMQASVMTSATTWFEHPTGTAAFIVNVNSAVPGISSNTGYRLAAQ